MQIIMKAFINQTLILLSLLLATTVGLSGTCASDKKAKEFLYKDSLIDEVNLFTKNENDSLRVIIEDFSINNKVELMIVIKDSLRGKTIFNLSEQIYNESRLTQIESAKWVLIVVVTTARQLRINVGTGSEERLSDKNCDLVIRKEIVPQFKENKYFDGLKNGIVALETVLKENK